MTDLQQDLEDAMDDLAGRQESWSFGSATFQAVADDLKPGDPRMAGSTDRHIELRVKTRLLTYPWPKRGNEGTSGGVTYRVVRSDHDAVTGISTMIVVQASAMEPTS